VFSRLHLEAVKKIKSIQLILSENMLALCINNYELISKFEVLDSGFWVQRFRVQRFRVQGFGVVVFKGSGFYGAA